jgi:hypothetical protein
MRSKLFKSVPGSDVQYEVSGCDSWTLRGRFRGLSGRVRSLVRLFRSRFDGLDAGGYTGVDVPKGLIGGDSSTRVIDVMQSGESGGESSKICRAGEPGESPDMIKGASDPYREGRVPVGVGPGPNLNSNGRIYPISNGRFQPKARSQDLVGHADALQLVVFDAIARLLRRQPNSDHHGTHTLQRHTEVQEMSGCAAHHRMHTHKGRKKIPIPRYWTREFFFCSEYHGLSDDSWTTITMEQTCRLRRGTRAKPVFSNKSSRWLVSDRPRVARYSLICPARHRHSKPAPGSCRHANSVTSSFATLAARTCSDTACIQAI